MQPGLITRILRGDWLHVINDYIDYICNRHPCSESAIAKGVLLPLGGMQWLDGMQGLDALTNLAHRTVRTEFILAAIFAGDS